MTKIIEVHSLFVLSEDLLALIFSDFSVTLMLLDLVFTYAKTYPKRCLLQLE